MEHELARNNDIATFLGITPSQLVQLEKDNALKSEVTNLIQERTIEQHPLNKMLTQFIDEKNFFGPSDWKRYLGIDAPKKIVLPMEEKRLQKLLQSPCLFEPRKKIGENWHLSYVPSTVNRKKLTLEKWKMMKDQLFYEYTDKTAWYQNESFFTELQARHNWFLTYKGIVPNSLKCNYAKQLSLIPQNCFIPRAIECAPMYLQALLKNNEHINKDLWGRTSDDVNGERVIIGKNDQDGFKLSKCSDSEEVSIHGIHVSMRLHDTIY